MQAQIVAGDTLSFLTATPGYPASEGWELKHRLVPRSVGAAAIDLTSTAEGDDHRTEASAAATAAWIAGAYGWASWVELGSAKHSIDSGQVVIQPNPRAAAAGADSRSQAERARDDCKAALAAFAGGTNSGVRRYRIGEREMEFSNRADVVKELTYWENEVARELRNKRLAQGRPDPRKTYVRINRE
jgi:hypothetical protein